MHFEDVTVGTALPEVSKGPMSTAHIVRWSAAIENWHRIHYDYHFATQHDDLPDLLVNGSWKQHVLLQLLTDWVGRTGWVWKMKVQYRGMNVRGETLTAWGRVTNCQKRGQYGVVSVEIGLRNQDGAEGSPGTAALVLPCKGGPVVPYPFDPRAVADEATSKAN